MTSLYYTADIWTRQVTIYLPADRPRANVQTLQNALGDSFTQPEGKETTAGTKSLPDGSLRVLRLRGSTGLLNDNSGELKTLLRAAFTNALVSNIWFFTGIFNKAWKTGVTVAL